MTKEARVHIIDLSKVNENQFKRRHVGCIVTNNKGQILLQQRGPDWDRFPSCLATFGGAIESEETPMQALIRELNEELGAIVEPKDVICLDVLTEATSHHQELIYGFFWRDGNETITGCYEGEITFYENSENAMKHPLIMDDVIWFLKTCRKRNLIK